MSGTLNGDAAETVRHAIDRFSRKPVEGDSSTAAQRRAEALVRICEVALKRGTEAEGVRPSVTYVMRERRSHERSALAEGLFGVVLTPAERQRILCDCSISRVVMSGKGEAVDIGRSTPVWPTAIRKAIVARDRCC